MLMIIMLLIEGFALAGATHNWRLAVAAVAATWVLAPYQAKPPKWMRGILE